MLSAFYNEQHEVSTNLQSMAQHHGPHKQLFLVLDDPLHKPLHQAYVPGFAAYDDGARDGHLSSLRPRFIFFAAACNDMVSIQ